MCFVNNRDDHSWHRLASESAARMADHDSLPAALRDVSNEFGIKAALDLHVDVLTKEAFPFL
jgi:hypothetical protein